ncbi:TPA: hypothetical protein ACKPIN_003284 [Pseudomonas aeruginosa]
MTEQALMATEALPTQTYRDPRDGKVIWSNNGEDWHNETLAEVLKRNDHLLVGSTVFRGEMQYPDPAGYIPDVDDVLIHMQEEAEGSDCGEWVEDYPEPSDEAKAELKALLEPIKAWARLHCRPDFGLVENVQEHVLTQEDIDQAMETEA